MASSESGKIASQPIEFVNKKLKEWDMLEYKMADLGVSSRNLSYLEETGLFPKEDRESGNWRKFNYIESIYILTVMALKRFGVKSPEILPFAKGVMRDMYCCDEWSGWGWFFPILGIHTCGIEVELFFSSDGYCNLLGSELATRHHEGFEDGEIRIRLSSIINQFRKNIGLEPIKLNKHLTLLPLRKSEIAAVHEMRGLAHATEFLKIKKTDGGKILVGRKKTESQNSELADDIKKVMKKHEIDDFTDVAFSVRQGGIANIEMNTSDIFNE